MKTAKEFMTEWLDTNNDNIVKGNWATEEVLIFALNYARHVMEYRSKLTDNKDTK